MAVLSPWYPPWLTSSNIPASQATDTEVQAAKGLPVGATGAVAAARFVGGTTSGAPTTGTFAVGDFIVDQSGAVWICTVAGSPGTWADMSSGKQLAYAESAVQQTNIGTTATDLTGLSITFTVATRPVEVHAFCPYMVTSAATRVVLYLRDQSDVVSRLSQAEVAASDWLQMQVFELITTPGTYTRKVSTQTLTSGTVGNNSGAATTVSHIKATTR